MMSKSSTEIGRRAISLLAALTLALMVSSGVALAITEQCQAQVDCFGTPEPDTLNGSDGNDIMFGRASADILKGFGGSDQLSGQGGGDRLSGGPGGIDALIGGRGKDLLNGGGATSHYFFGPNWGNDSITDKTTSTDEIFFRSDPAGGVIVTDDMIIDLGTDAGPEVETTSGTNTINWEGTINTVTSGYGDDEITGNASANLITGGGGADTIYGEEGDDEIRALDGSTEDTVHCGEGEDTVLYETDTLGVVSDSIDPDCEHQIANP